MVAPGRLTRQVARGRVIALAKATHFFIQDLLLGSENGLFSGIPIASSSPKRGEAGTDESGNLPADIFLVALVVAAVVRVWVILALLGLVPSTKTSCVISLVKLFMRFLFKLMVKGGPWWLSFC